MGSTYNVFILFAINSENSVDCVGNQNKMRLSPRKSAVIPDCQGHHRRDKAGVLISLGAVCYRVSFSTLAKLPSNPSPPLFAFDFPHKLSKSFKFFCFSLHKSYLPRDFSHSKVSVFVTQEGVAGGMTNECFSRAWRCVSILALA